MLLAYDMIDRMRTNQRSITVVSRWALRRRLPRTASPTPHQARMATFDKAA
jgi:hypothetical protein